MLSFVLLFGCTSTYNPGISNDTSSDKVAATVEDPKTLSEAQALASKDYSKYLFYFTVGHEGELFNVTLYFSSSKTNMASKLYHVLGFLIINRSEICNGSEDRYDKFIAVFDDSPAGEAWNWDFTGYCGYGSYNPWITPEQMQGIKSPKNPALTKAFAAVTIDPSKYLFYLQAFEGSNATGLFNATVYFISNETNFTKKYHVPGLLLINKSDICNGNKSKFNKVTVAYDSSPIGENDTWDEADNCNATSYYLWNTKEKLEAMKNPTFQISLFEHSNDTGPLNGNITCSGQYLGELVNGLLNTTKVSLLEKVHGNCSISLFGIYNGTPNIRFEECGWTLTESDIRLYNSTGYMLGDNTTLRDSIRCAPCSTTTSYITPNNPDVKSKLNRYLGSPTPDAFRDIGHLFGKLSDDFLYESDTDKFNKEDWYQLPSEFFSTNPSQGDCEDWSVAFLSLILARGPAPCYVVTNGYLAADKSDLHGGHSLVLCVNDGKPIIYNQYYMFTDGDIWEQLREDLDYDGSLTKDGVAYINPTGYYNDTFYDGDVNGVDDLYKKLGISG